MKLLNLGCGNSYHKDWLNIDFISNNEYVKAHNLLNGIPINDNQIDVVYHSHVLEHFSKEEGFHFMEECYRVLKKNGIIRVAVPDLEIIVKEYLRNLHLAIDGDTKAKNNYEWIKLELFDQMVRNESGGEMKNYLFQPVIPNESYVFNRIGLEGKIIRESFLKSEHRKVSEEEKKSSINKGLKMSLKIYIKGISNRLKLASKNKLTNEQIKALRIGEFRLGGEIHQWMYDRYSLTRLLINSGFKDVKICSAEESDILNWSNYQLDIVNGEVRKPDSLFIEAKKI